MSTIQIHILTWQNDLFQLDMPQDWGCRCRVQHLNQWGTPCSEYLHRQRSSIVSNSDHPYLHSDREANQSELLQAMLSLTEQLADCHTTGYLHGAVDAYIIPLVEGSIRIPPLVPGKSIRIEPNFRSPPDVWQLGLTSLPRRIADARKVLHMHGLQVEPTRIDIYHLGGLFCVLSGAPSWLAFLRSPVVRSTVPMLVRGVIDRTLGFERHTRCHDTSQLRRVLQDASRSAL